MTPELFRQIGEALYGPEWRGQLGRDLGVNSLSIRRWQSGAQPVPAGVVSDLQQLVSEEVEERTAALAALQRALRAIDEEVDNG